MSKGFIDLINDNVRDVIIFGTGRKAVKAFIECCGYGVHIVCFADQVSCRSQYVSAVGKKVIDEEELIKCYKNIPVIIASQFWNDIEERLRKKGMEKLYLSLDAYSAPVIMDGYLRELDGYIFEEDTYYILCPYNIGDLLLWACGIKQYRKQNKHIKKISLIVRESLKETAELFESIDEVIASDVLRDRLVAFSLETHIWSLSNYWWGHVRRDWDCYQMQTANGVALGKGYELYPGFFLSKGLGNGIWLDGNYERPQVGRENLTDHHNAVVLMPYANSIEMIAETFWENLVKQISDQGYEVYTNVSWEELAIEGTQKLMGAILDTVLFCATCRAVVSLRSGMCDLLSLTTDTKMIVLYPDQSTRTMFDIGVIWNKESSVNICFNEHESEELINQIVSEI